MLWACTGRARHVPLELQGALVAFAMSTRAAHLSRTPVQHDGRPAALRPPLFPARLDRPPLSWSSSRFASSPIYRAPPRPSSTTNKLPTSLRALPLHQLLAG